jgi:hypothetical protein
MRHSLVRFEHTGQKLKDVAATTRVRGGPPKLHGNAAALFDAEGRVAKHFFQEASRLGVVAKLNRLVGDLFCGIDPLVHPSSVAKMMGNLPERRTLERLEGGRSLAVQALAPWSEEVPVHGLRGQHMPVADPVIGLNQ